MKTNGFRISVIAFRKHLFTNGNEANFKMKVFTPPPLQTPGGVRVFFRKNTHGREGGPAAAAGKNITSTRHSQKILGIAESGRQALEILRKSWGAANPGDKH